MHRPLCRSRACWPPSAAGVPALQARALAQEMRLMGSLAEIVIDMGYESLRVAAGIM